MRPKVCFDIEYPVEAQAEARLKRKATANREATAAKKSKPAKAKASKNDAPLNKHKQQKQPKYRSRRTTGIMKIRKQRREQQMKEEEEESRKRARKAGLGLDNLEGTIVAAPKDGDFFWEVAAVLGRRIRRNRVEYLIRWKGCSEEDNTWEPAANLCDSAMEEAVKYCKAEKLKAKKRADDEKKLFGDSSSEKKEVTAETSNEEKKDNTSIVEANTSTKDVADNSITKAAKSDIAIDDNDCEDEEESLVVEDATLNWTDADQVIFREVKRINVNDPGAAAIVKEDRINGTPVVLVGHVGWANFAQRWLTEKKAETKEAPSDSHISTAELPHEKAKPSNGNVINLDLSTEKYELDIPKMIKDIGDEDVPVIKRNYDEVKPIHGTIPAAKFLSECWPSSESEAELQDSKKKGAKFYLHQWQFPLSDTAGGKLCHQNNPLPNGIMGEDLLKYWLDLPQCKLDSPLQYIFMGRTDTNSRLHKDPGGLEISIAPISGQKECVLVHRDDSRCLYHLTASLDEIDLQRFPLLSQARVYKTVIKPGEILLMPNGTYHQCRNVTPCLSYSRFHLDTVNLLPFVMSLVNGDAPEIEHRDVLWNLASALIKKVDEVVDLVQDRVLAYRVVTDVVTGDTRETVETLLALRNFIREVARRDEVNKAVKGPGDKSKEELKPELHDFGVLAADVDVCLHDYRYRESKEIPKLKSRKGKVLTNTLSKGVRKNCVGRDLNKFMIDNKPVVVFNSSLENNYMSLRNADVEKHYPLANKHKVGKALIGKLTIGDMLACRLEQKCVKAEVLEVVPQMKAAYISFEDYPSVYDEYQPFDLLRLPAGDEITHNDIKPGLVVLDFSNTNEYRAVVQSTIDGPMVRVKLIVSQHTLTRLVSPAMILGRYMGRWGSSGKKGSSDDSDGKKAAPGGIVSPSTTSDISDIAVEEES